MTELTTSGPPLRTVSGADLLQEALIDSRQRWREFVDLTADFAFETDEWGRFVLITPDPALGWPARRLIGQPAASLLAEGGIAGPNSVAGDGGFNPFRVSAPVRNRTAWLKRFEGGLACLTFCAGPIRDSDGRITGARGLGIDMTELDGQVAQLASGLRRAEVLDHILWRMGQEVMDPQIMGAALDTLVNALGAQGTAVVAVPADEVAPKLIYVSGGGVEDVIDSARRQLLLGDPKAVQSADADGRPMLIATCRTRSGEQAALVAWRAATARGWDREDYQLLGSAVNLVRMVLEREATQQELARQARTDPLTGLLNRPAFLEEIERHSSRLDKETLPGTLLLADLDSFRPVNDRLGHEAGDRVLRGTAALLRKTFRPGDLIARLGGDEFAIWMNGADHMTAAERAEYLRDAAPLELAEIAGPDGPRLSLSIGIASREPGDGETLANLMRRANAAMSEVKRGGRGHWRVALRGRP